jgi:hypothetical protein
METPVKSDDDRPARQLAERPDPNNLADAAKTARERVLSTTKPPTMADVDWDHEKHYLAEAIAFGGRKVVMVRPGLNGACIVTDKGTWLRGLLTPNGKRYKLAEVTDESDEPTHPATLTTEQDYANAPMGTVVAEPGRFAWTKSYGESYCWSQGGAWLTNREMAGTERQMLREGWGK